VTTDVDGDSANWWLRFYDAVTAYGDTSQRFAAGDGEWQTGFVRAVHRIDKTGQGDLTIDGYHISLYDDVDVLTAGGSLLIGSDYDAPASDWGTSYIESGGDLTAERM